MTSLARIAKALISRGFLGSVSTELGTAVPTAANIGSFPVNGLVVSNDKVYRNVGSRTAPVFAVEPQLGVIKQTILMTAFTDGGGVSGTYVMTDQIPDGAIFLGTKVLVPVAWTGDTTATATIGDGTDVDRYNTSTIPLFTVAATGVQAGIPSGTKYHIAAASVTITVTSSTDFGLVNPLGSMEVSLFFINTN